MEVALPPAPEDHADVQVFDEIRHIEHLARGAIAERLPAGLTYPQFEVLNLLARRGDGLTPAEIADALRATRSGFTNTLQRLRAHDLVREAPCAADGRRKLIRLTAEGRAAYARALAAIRPRMESLRAGFTQATFREALPFLRALRARLGETP